MSAFEDLYKRLGVEVSASYDEIKRAYRRLARQYHPDFNPADPQAHERFILIAQAFEVLSQPDRRALYDEFGAASLADGFDPQAARRPQPRYKQPWSWQRPAPRQSTDDQSRDGSLSDPFVSVMDELAKDDPFAQSAFVETTRGADVTREIAVELELIATGGAVTLDDPFGGSPLVVRIPAGAQDGEQLCLEGMGQPSPDGGPAGDLRLNVRVLPHAWLRRVGLNLEADLPITMTEAILGARIELQTPHGPCTMTLPEGTHSGARLRLRQLGISYQGERGDMYLVVQIKAPDVLDERVKQAALALEDAYLSPVRKR